VAAAHRNLGIGRKLLAAVEAEAAERDADAILVAAPGEGAAAALLAGAGWLAAGDAVADGRRLWRRSLGTAGQDQS
jgi:GNAT superfamily N-acetyltransferase